MNPAWPGDWMAVLWGVAALVAVSIFLPSVLSAVGLNFCRSRIDDDPAALEPTGDDPEYDELFAQLRRLGFEPVGTRCKTHWFFLHHWRRTFRSRLFATRSGDCLAVTFKLRSWDRWRLCFVTAFSDGAVVETANQMASLRIDEPQHLRWGLVTADRGLLLQRHRELCEHFAEAAPRRVAKLTADEISRLHTGHELRHTRTRHRFTGARAVSNAALVMGVGALLVYRCCGSAPYVVPVGVIGGGLLWPFIHARLFRASAQTIAARDCESRTD